MNKRFVAVVLVALGVAGLALLVFIKVVGGGPSKDVKPVATAQIWAASRDLPVGTLLQRTDVTEIQWPGAIPQGALKKEGDVCPLVGRGVASKILQGEPVVEFRLAPKGAGAGLAATIPDGYRAVAVRVNEIIGLAGFVVPGQIVDVLISGNPPGAPPTTGTQSRTLLQKVQVLSAGQNLEKDPEGKPISVTVVNLLVKPEEAELLSLASTETKLQLVLRNPGDQETVKTPGTSVSTLFGGKNVALPAAGGEVVRKPRVVKPAVVAPVVKEAPPVMVEVIQGDSRNTVKFAEESR